jgi:SsrA-binding protein
MGRKKRAKQVVPDGVKMLVRNRRAFHDYQIGDRVEAGLVLLGSEVKSLREGRASLADGYAEIRNNEAWLINVQIKEYPWANRFNHEPLRQRKLLLHKREIRKLGIKTLQRGYTLVPLAIYLKDGKFKIELGLAAGKRQYDKRQAAKEATTKREMDLEMKRH